MVGSHLRIRLKSQSLIDCVSSRSSVSGICSSSHSPKKQHPERPPLTYTYNSSSSHTLAHLQERKYPSCDHRYHAPYALSQPAAFFRRLPFVGPRHPSPQARHHLVCQRRTRSFSNNSSAPPLAPSVLPRPPSSSISRPHYHLTRLAQDHRSINRHTRSRM